MVVVGGHERVREVARGHRSGGDGGQLGKPRASLVLGFEVEDLETIRQLTAHAG